MYYRMAEGNPEVAPPFRFRILTPSLVKAVMPLMAKVPHGSWNVTSMSFLAVNTFFLSLAGFCLMHITFLLLGDRIIALMSAILFITSFTAVNQYLAGMVDAAESFFLASIVLCSLRGWWMMVPLLLGLGALGKDTTLLQGTTWLGCYSLHTCLRLKRFDCRSMLSTFVSIMFGVGVLLATRAVVGGATYPLHRLSMDQFFCIPTKMVSGVFSRDNVYAFLLLLPLGLPRLKHIPSPYLPISLIMGAVALLAGSYSQIGSTNFSRPLFNAIGPLLSMSTALFLSELLKPRQKNH